MADVFHIPMPDGVSRVESGAVQFGDDWPALHLRGDDAAYLGFNLQQLLDCREKVEQAAPELAWILHTLDGYRKMIQGHVVVKPA